MIQIQSVPVGTAPVNAMSNEACYDYAQSIAQEINDVTDSIPNEIPSVEEVIQSEEEKKARKTLKGFMDYIKSQKFKDDVHDTAKKYRLPEREVANTFIGKVLGTIADVCGIVIGTVRNTVHTVIDLLSTILNGAVDIICNVANSLTRVVTLNKTCVA